MATITLDGPIQCHRGTAAAMTSNNPTLLAGEWGVETDTGKTKMGAGAWNSLAYQSNATSPLIVASFAAKGLAGAIGNSVLLSAAPAGMYMAVASVSWTAVSYDATVFPYVGGAFFMPIYRSGFLGVPTYYFGSDLDTDGGLDGGYCTFKWAGGNIVVGTSYDHGTGTDSYDISVTLIRLPEPSGALYYLNAVADVAVDAGATVTLDPVGPTFASGATCDITAVASSGYHFVAWTGDDTSSTNPLVLSMTAAKSITATFAED